ncbi:MAG: DegT/DnrJ/EryC1/StrS family aminotransferase, partial [Mesotoga sp.]|nr:DegT/DnrJ/EryC1/StrS family aminotransferase [Mesotoga sp.]
IDKYGWVDIGSSFLPSDIIAAFLWAQLEHIDEIQAKRLEIWNQYNETLKPIANKAEIRLPFIPDYATNNAHMYYIVAEGKEQRAEGREQIIMKLKDNGIQAVIHYQSLHNSKFYSSQSMQRECPQSDYYSQNLLRLPMWVELPQDIYYKILSSLINE